MSRQPSPGPSQPHVATQVFQANPPPTNRQKSKIFTPGIAAGAEDVKYQTKYKELKRKVKEIEADNDKLQFKVLQAKKSINRMKIERAVLYDRLSQVPPSPEMNDRQPLPPLHSGPGIPPHHSPYMTGSAGHLPRDIREHVSIDPNDHSRVEYLHTHPNMRMSTGPDGRPVPVQDMPMGPGVAPSAHTLPSVHSSRHAPSSGHGSPRALPPLSKMPPVQHLEPSRPQGPSHSYSPQLPPLPGTSRRHSLSNSRSHSSSRSRTHQSSSQYSQHTHSHQHPSDALSSSVQRLGSPSLPGEREKSRRHDGHERTASHSRHQVPVPKNSMHSPPGTRSSTRIHHQQHLDLSPIAHERKLEVERDWEYDSRLMTREPLEFEREQIARERDISVHSHRHISPPPFAYRTGRQPAERAGDYHESPSYKIREELGYHRELPGPGTHSRLSRSGTPVSGSGPADGPPRPDSRGQYYSRHPVHEDEYVREERRAHSRDRSVGVFASSERPYSEGRKRNRQEMELDEDHAGEANSAIGGGSRKRIHQDHASVRGADSQEEDEGKVAL